MFSTKILEASEARNQGERAKLPPPPVQDQHFKTLVQLGLKAARFCWWLPYFKYLLAHEFWATQIFSGPKNMHLKALLYSTSARVSKNPQIFT